MNSDVRVELWSASWCSPCKVIKREIDALKSGADPASGSTLRQNLSFLLPFLSLRDVEESMEESLGLGISSIPHWEIYIDGSRIQKGFKEISDVVSLIQKNS